MPIPPSILRVVKPEDIEKARIAEKIKKGEITKEEATLITAEREATITQQPVTTQYGIVHPQAPPIPPTEKAPPFVPITEVTVPTEQEVPPAVLEWAGLTYAWQQTPEAIASAGKRWWKYKRRVIETIFVHNFEPAR